MLELAKEYDLPIRLPVAQGAGSTLLGLPDELVEPMFERAPQLLQQFDVRHPDAFFASFYDLSATKEEFLRIVDGLGDGVFEVMTHPGYSDADLAASSGYAVQRERELAILTDAEVIAEIRKRNIELVSFAQI